MEGSRWALGLEHVLALLRERTTTPHAQWDIDMWGDLDGRGVGPRVAEVSLLLRPPGSPGSVFGFSFMQGDIPHGLAACAAVERVIIAVVEGWGRRRWLRRCGG